MSAAEGAVKASSPEQANERLDEWPSTYVSILVCSKPQCNASLRNAVLRHPTPSNSIQYHFIPCNATLRPVTSWHATLRHATQRHVTPCNAIHKANTTPRHAPAKPRYAAPCNATSGNAETYHAPLSYASPRHATQRRIQLDAPLHQFPPTTSHCKE